MITKIILIVVFSVLTISSIVVFIMFLSKQNKFRKINNEITECLDLTELITKTPIKANLIRLNAVNAKLSNYEKSFFNRELVVYRFKYQVIFDDKNFFQGNILKLGKFISKLSSKSINNTLHKEIIKIKSDLYDNLNDCRVIDSSLRNIFSFEAVQRNAFINLRDIYTHIICRLDLISISYDYNYNALNNIKKTINNLFQDFHKKLQIGLYDDSWDAINGIEDYLIEMLKIVDTCSFATEKLLSEFPLELNNISNYIENLDSKEFIVENVYKIQSDIDSAIEKLKLFNYGDINSYIYAIEVNIKQLKNYISSELTIKESLDNNKGIIKECIDQLLLFSTLLLKEANAKKDMSKPDNTIFIRAQSIRSKMDSYSVEYNSLFPNHSLASNIKNEEYEVKKAKTTKLVGDLIEAYNEMKIISSAVRTNAINLEVLEMQILSVESSLSQILVKLNQNLRLKELADFAQRVINYKEEVKVLTSYNLTEIKTTEQYEKLKSRISIFENRLYVLDYEINCEIAKDRIAQALIGYCASRNINKYDSITKLKNLYANRRISECISGSIEILLKEKNNMRDEI